MNTKSFNIRVYAIIFNDKEDAILVADEYQKNMFMTKFPGGGLHFGEGTIECLRREIEEEIEGKISQIIHFYTTDFFQQDFFNPHRQLISIYYKAKLSTNKTFPVSAVSLISPHDEKIQNGHIIFRWHPIRELHKKIFTFPIDQYVCELLQQNKLL